jgi:hypothetical protein
MCLPKLIFLILFSFFVFPGTAYAYIDPGSGSFVFQLFLGALLGALFSVKLFWNKIKTSLKNLFSRRKKWQK